MWKKTLVASFENETVFFKLMVNFLACCGVLLGLDQFFIGQITHAEWCQVTCDRFAERGIREEHVAKVATSLMLVPGTRETLRKLKRSGISLFLVGTRQRRVPGLDEFAILLRAHALCA